jgi:hypothetical protein
VVHFGIQRRLPIVANASEADQPPATTGARTDAGPACVERRPCSEGNTQSRARSSAAAAAAAWRYSFGRSPMLPADGGLGGSDLRVKTHCAKRNPCVVVLRMASVSIMSQDRPSESGSFSVTGPSRQTHLAVPNQRRSSEVRVSADGNRRQVVWRPWSGRAGLGRLLAAPTGTTRIKGPVTEGILQARHS